jgi:predicted nucleotidyltransferase component of viral defense system
MSMTDSISLHADQPEFFREALAYTARSTEFDPRFIEKDYFCSVVLQYIDSVAASLVFKGGTCLAKVHAGFYRLSEDLDFSIPVPVDVTRAQRSRLARPLGSLLADVASQLPGVSLRKPLTGANNSTQYNAVLAYGSVFGGEGEIKFEVALREPLLTPAVRGIVNTLLLDPISGENALETFRVSCLSPIETMAEKIRAALCRREAAIRDFYDIHHAVSERGLDLDDEALLELVRAKISIDAGNVPDCSAERLGILKPQGPAELGSVIRERDLLGFDLEDTFGQLAVLAEGLRS